MDIHYNAFISYRHHPDDIRVATEIHRGLERFKVPKAIKKRTNASLRLFRDKDELPITSSLTDDITRALENSDFLIVICSEHTKESVWVQREIETFLRTHSRDKVLTVLAGGDPYAVIPEILLYEDVLNPITGQIHREECEPLSCDWRMKKRKAVKEELPRLAAALLGCGYDELRQRQRQYRMRRIVTAFSLALAASLCLTAYFIYTSIQIQKANDELHAANIQIQEANVQIQDNLDQALRNQSRYLASSSKERMEAGDRMTALALAMAALPHDEDQRPYVPEAEHALSDALNAYQSQARVSAEGAFVVDGLVRQFEVTEDGRTIFILDSRGIITVWDTVTFQNLETIYAGEYDPSKMYLTGKGNVLVVPGYQGERMVCFRPDGTKLWEKPACKDQAFLDDRSTLMLLQYEFGLEGQIVFLDPDTGEETAPQMNLTDAEGEMHPSGFYQVDYDSNRPIILEFYASFLSGVFALKLDTGTIEKVIEVDTSMAAGSCFIDCVSLDRDGNILVMRGDGSGIYNGSYQTFEITGTDRADILCFDSKTLRQKWQTEITAYAFSGINTMESVPGTEWLLCQSGNTLLLLEGATGKPVTETVLPEIPLVVRVDEEKTWGILENGAYYTFDYSDGGCTSNFFMEEKIDSAAVNQGYYVHTPLDRHVTLYRSLRDEAGVVFEGEFKNNPEARLICGRYMAVPGYEALWMLDLETTSVLWQKELEYGWEALGFSQNGEELWMWNKRDKCAAALRTETGESREVPIFLGDWYTYLESNMLLLGDTLMYILETDGKMELRRMDLSEGSQMAPMDLSIFAKKESDYSATTELITGNDHFLWLRKDKSQLYVLNLQTGELKLAADSATQLPILTWDEREESLLYPCGNELLHMTADGTVVHKIDLGEKKGISACFYGSEYLVLCDDYEVYRYDQTGKQLSVTGLSVYDSFSSKVAYLELGEPQLFWHITGDGDVILNAFGAGNIIECENWQSRAFVPNLFACSEDGNTLICRTSYQFYAFDRYSTREQIEKGHQALGDFQLSEEERRAYGLITE